VVTRQEIRLDAGGDTRSMDLRVTLKDAGEIQEVGQQNPCGYDGDCKGGSAGELASHTVREYTGAASLRRASRTSAAPRNSSFAIVRHAEKERPFRNIWGLCPGGFVGS